VNHDTCGTCVCYIYIYLTIFLLSGVIPSRCDLKSERGTSGKAVETTHLSSLVIFFVFVFSRVKRMFYKTKSHEAPQTGTSQYTSQEGQVRAFFWGACIFVSRFSCFGTFHTRNSEAGLAHSGENVVIATWKTIDWVREHGTVCMYELMVGARTNARGARSARWELT
jgi:hypothetical protein